MTTKTAIGGVTKNPLWAILVAFIAIFIALIVLNAILGALAWLVVGFIVVTVGANLVHFYTDTKYSTITDGAFITLWIVTILAFSFTSARFFPCVFWLIGGALGVALFHWLEPAPDPAAETTA